METLYADDDDDDDDVDFVAADGFDCNHSPAAFSQILLLVFPFPT